MVLLRNITQPYHKALQIALTMLSRNLKVDYIIEDRLERLQSPGIRPPGAPTCCFTVKCDTSSLILLIGAQPSRIHAVLELNAWLKIVCVCMCVCGGVAHLYTHTSVTQVCIMSDALAPQDSNPSASERVWFERQRRSLASVSFDNCRPSGNPSVSHYLTPPLPHTCIHVCRDSRHVTCHCIKDSRLTHSWLNRQIITFRAPSSATGQKLLLFYLHSCFNAHNRPVPYHLSSLIVQWSSVSAVQLLGWIF